MKAQIKKQKSAWQGQGLWRRCVGLAILSLAKGGPVGATTQCHMTVIGKQGAVAATSLAVRSAGSLAQQTAQTESLAAASIDCTGPPPLISGGMLFMDFSNNFTGVNFVVDDSLPGAVLKLVGQDVHIRDSTFDNVASGADGTLIALNSSVIITNTTFAFNIQAAAGALFLNGSRATVFDCLFDRNKGFQAGGIKAVGGSSLLVNLTVFRYNSGAQGGALGMEGGGQLQVVNSVFLRNTAQNGAGVYVQKVDMCQVDSASFYSNVAAVNGGGISQSSSPGSTLTNTLFSGNRAQAGGGGYYNNCRQLRMLGNSFENNTASSGAGGLELNLCSGNVEGCAFAKNKGEKGGGLFMDSCASSVHNCTFDSNAASLLGGGLYRSGMTGDAAVSGCSFAKNKAGQYGGAIYEANVADGSIAGCSFSRNTAPEAAALYSRMSSTRLGPNTNLQSEDIETTDVR